VGLLTGIKFPVANGYMPLQTLACEGAEIGTIMLGAQRFSVQVVVGPPSSAHAPPN
jgi:hypothetical protein